MSDLSGRSLRVALSGFVHDDDPTIIADMMAEIDRLRAENERLTGRVAEIEGERDTAARALAEMRKALLMYGEHESDCEAGTAIREGDFDPRRDKCTCGFRATLSRTEGKG